MPKPEFEDPEIWEKLYSAEEDQIAQGATEHSWTEGEDGEGEFDRKVLASCKGKEVLDIGCGTGEFTFEIAATARRVAGIDFSERALKKALQHLESRKLGNVEFRRSKADRLPYPEGSFDLVVSRRGPATDTDESLREAYRVLRKGGRLITQEIGERDKQNWALAFGRGQMLGKESVAMELRKRLAHAGFRDITLEEFETNEYFEGIQDLLMRIENSPIIPDFDRKLDEHHVQEVAKLFMTPKGIMTNAHRVLVSATR